MVGVGLTGACELAGNWVLSEFCELFWFWLLSDDWLLPELCELSAG